MASDIKYALMAGRVYQSTCRQINWLPDLQSLGWTEFFPRQESSGFEAISFQKGGRGNDVLVGGVRGERMRRRIRAVTINGFKTANDDATYAWRVAA